MSHGLSGLELTFLDPDNPGPLSQLSLRDACRAASENEPGVPPSTGPAKGLVQEEREQWGQLRGKGWLEMAGKPATHAGMTEWGSPSHSPAGGPRLALGQRDAQQLELRGPQAQLCGDMQRQELSSLTCTWAREMRR